MAEDTWYSRAVPILGAIAELEGGEQAYVLTIGDLADRVGLDPQEVAVEVERLIDGGYLSGKLTKLMSGGNVRPWHLTGPVRLAPEGARVAGLWPSRDPYETLMTLLERRVAEAPDEETRSKWRKVRDTIGGLGKDVGTNLIASVLVELGKRGL